MTENRTERTAGLGLLALMQSPAGGGPGSSAQGWAFPYWNQLYLDAIIAALHEAPRDGAALLSPPASGPTVGLSSEDGYLPAGLTLEVCQTFVDEWGRETSAGTAATISTGTPIADPDTAPTLGAPSASGTGFEGGLLEVAYAWIDAAAGETIASPIAQVDVPYLSGGLKSEVLVTLPAAPASVGAAGAFIYARHRSGNWVRAVAISDDAETEATLDGTWISCFVSLPLANSTGAGIAIDITGIADASGNAAYTRFYVQTLGETWSSGDRRLCISGADEWDPATVSYPLVYRGASGEMAPGYPPPVTQILPIRQVDLTTEAMGALDEQYIESRVTRDSEICQLLGGPYVQTGLLVTAKDPASSGVQSSEGWAVAASNIWHVAADTSVPISAGDATHARIDLVCVNASGVVRSSWEDALLKGTPATPPVAPSTPEGYVLLAEVLVDVGATVITADKITDRRTLGPGLGGITVYEAPEDPDGTLDWDANLPATGEAGQLALVMADPTDPIERWAHQARLYMWNDKIAVPAWEIINPMQPTEHWADFPYQEYTETPGTCWLQQQAEDGPYRLKVIHPPGFTGSGDLPLYLYGVGGMGDRLGLVAWCADKAALDTLGEPWWGEGTLGFTYSTKCWYVWDGSGWVDLGPGTAEEDDITCGGSTTANFTIDLPGPCLITQVAAAATSAGTLDYDLELFEDSDRTILAYKVESVDAASYDDRIPLEWFGGTTCYGKVTNNSGDAITDLDLTIKTRR